MNESKPLFQNPIMCNCGRIFSITYSFRFEEDEYRVYKACCKECGAKTDALDGKTVAQTQRMAGALYWEGEDSE